MVFKGLIFFRVVVYGVLIICYCDFYFKDNWKFLEILLFCLRGMYLLVSRKYCS